jgi:NitT/TauT family transport system permease protein
VTRAWWSWSRAGAPALSFVVVVAAWETVGRLELVPPYLLPSPSQILARMIESHAVLLRQSLVTSIEIVLGFLLALVAGVLLAIATVYVKAFEAAIYPWIVASQVIPKVALGPLFMVWLGFGLMPKVVIGFLISFFPILINTVVGLKSVDTDSVFLLQSMGAGRWKVFRYLLFPNALPNTFAGMKVAITLATVGAVVGEFVGASEGLGYLLLFANGTTDTTLLFSAIVMLSLVALVFYVAVSLLETVFVRWHVSRRRESVAVTM